MGVLRWMAERFGLLQPSVGTIARFMERGLENRPLTPIWDIKRFADEGYRRNVLVYACVKLRGKSAAQVKFVAKRKNKSGDLEPLPDAHPLQKLLSRPNAEQSQREFVQQAWMHRDVGGASVIHKVRARSGVPVELWLLRPDRVEPVPDESGFVQWYEFPSDLARRERIPTKDVVYYRDADYLDDYYGLSKIAVLARQGDIDNESADYMRAVFLNSGMPAGALKVKGDVVLGREIRDAMRTEWKDRYGRGRARPSWLGIGEFGAQSNSSGWGDIAVLDADVDWIKMGSAFNDMNLDGIFQHTETRICAAFGVPPSSIGAKAGLDRNTYSNAEQTDDWFWNNTMVPDAADFAEKLTMEVAPEFGEGNVVEPDYSGIRALQEDKDARAKLSSQGWIDGVVMFDEYRIDLGKDPLGPATIFLGDGENGAAGLEVKDIGTKFKWQLPGSGAQSGKSAEEPAALMAQRLYLAVNSEQPLLSAEEAREMINRAGGTLTGPAPEARPKAPNPFDSGNGQPPNQLAPGDKKKGQPELPPGDDEDDEDDTEEQRVRFLWHAPFLPRPRLQLSAGKRPAWKRLHEAADDKSLSIRRCVSKAFRLSKEGIEIQALANALFVKDSMKAEALALTAFRENGMPIIRKTMCSALGSLYRSGAKVGARDTRVKQGTGPTETHAPPNLDPGEDGAFAETRVAELVTDVTEATRTTIRRFIEGMFEEGYSARRAATRIRDTIGLTKQGLQRLENWEQKQRARGVTGDALDASLSRFSRKLIRERALTIARTEGIRAVSEGQSSIWEKAVESGILPQDQEIFWIVTEDSRACNICLPMDGQTIKVGEMFSTGDGGTVSAPPAHPRCRCARGLR